MDSPMLEIGKRASLLPSAQMRRLEMVLALEGRHGGPRSSAIMARYVWGDSDCLGSCEPAAHDCDAEARSFVIRSLNLPLPNSMIVDSPLAGDLAIFGSRYMLAENYGVALGSGSILSARSDGEPCVVTVDDFFDLTVHRKVGVYRVTYLRRMPAYAGAGLRPGPKFL